MTVLVTGGAGYIGSHAVRRLLETGRRVVVVDNLFRGNLGAVEALRTLGSFDFVQADIRDTQAMAQVLREHEVRDALHFAAVAYVRESVEQPLLYYDTNTAGALSLLEAMERAPCVERFVFSSTCATYGSPPPARIPIREDCPQRPINPYGWSKLFVERILEDRQRAAAAQGRPFAFARLRYFNVAGADRQGLLGEDHDPETHIIPLAIFSALGRRGPFRVLGTDHATPDGSCVRDYIHVDDLVEAHLLALEALDPADASRCALTYNLGLGRGFSVLEVLGAVERVVGRPVPVEFGPRHPADPPTLVTDASRIAADLGWRPRVTSLEEIVDSAYRWFRDHPRGYGR